MNERNKPVPYEHTVRIDAGSQQIPLIHVSFIALQISQFLTVCAGTKRVSVRIAPESLCAVSSSHKSCSSVIESVREKVRCEEKRARVCASKKTGKQTEVCCDRHKLWKTTKNTTAAAKVVIPRCHLEKWHHFRVDHQH